MQILNSFIHIYGYIYIYVNDDMDVKLGLAYILLEDDFHSSPFYSLFPDSRSEREEKRTPHFRS